MKTQGERMRIIAENIANADSSSDVPGGDPYRRKTISFKEQLDRTTGVRTVQVAKVGTDPTDFETKFDPGNPGADAKGYVRLPNVNTLVEMMDMREAQRSYEANLKMVEMNRTMMLRTIDLLRS